MQEMTTIKVEKPVVEWLNSLKGHLEWEMGRKYTLNDALIVILAEYDTKLAIRDGHMETLTGKKKKEAYMKRRLEQFWGNEDIPNLTLSGRSEFFKGKK